MRVETSVWKSTFKLEVYMVNTVSKTITCSYLHSFCTKGAFSLLGETNLIDRNISSNRGRNASSCLRSTESGDITTSLFFIRQVFVGGKCFCTSGFDADEASTPEGTDISLTAALAGRRPRSEEPYQTQHPWKWHLKTPQSTRKRGQR
jgi:hypothetical protein